MRLTIPLLITCLLIFIVICDAGRSPSSKQKQRPGKTKVQQKPRNSRSKCRTCGGGSNPYEIDITVKNEPYGPQPCSTCSRSCPTGNCNKRPRPKPCSTCGGNNERPYQEFKFTLRPPPVKPRPQCNTCGNNGGGGDISWQYFTAKPVKPRPNPQENNGGGGEISWQYFTAKPVKPRPNPQDNNFGGGDISWQYFTAKPVKPKPQCSKCGNNGGGDISWQYFTAKPKPGGGEISWEWIRTAPPVQPKPRPEPYKCKVCDQDITWQVITPAPRPAPKPQCNSCGGQKRFGNEEIDIKIHIPTERPKPPPRPQGGCQSGRCGCQTRSCGCNTCG